MVRAEDIQKEINEILHNKLLGGKVLLQDCRFVDENSRLSPSYGDPMYAPFYYHLGKLVKPRSVMSMSFNLGFLEKCFFMSCKETDKFLAFRRDDSKQYYSTRMGFYNVRKSFKKEFLFYQGDINDDRMSVGHLGSDWDLVFLNEDSTYDEILLKIEHSWKLMAEGAMLVVENVCDIKRVKKAFEAFTDSVDGKAVVFETRYGSGVLTK